MTEESGAKKFTDHFKTFQFWFFALMGPGGLLSAIVGLVNLFQGNVKVATTALVIVGVGFLYAVPAYIRNAKVRHPRRVILLKEDAHAEKYYRYGAKARKRALMAIFPLTGIVLSSFVLFIHDRYKSPPTLVILVADFDGPEPKNYRVTETIIEQLMKNTEGYADITVRSLGHFDRC